MFGLGIWELALILVVALLVLGPEKLPRIARQAGRALRELRRAASEFQASLSVEVDQIEKSARQTVDSKTLRRDLTDAVKSSVGVDQASTFKAELQRDIKEAVEPVADIAAEVTTRPDPYATAARTSKPEGETEDDGEQIGDNDSDDGPRNPHT